MTRGDRARRHFPSTALPIFFALVLAALAVAAPAAADDTIKQPGDHPHYSVEVEPHLLLGWGWGYGGGFGFGGRFSIPVVQNGFIPSINNSVAISFGVDALFYNGCYYNDGNCGATYLWFPVLMQWNFFVAQRWSVFGEPGLALYNGWWNGCNGPCPRGGPGTFGIEPALYLGGRYHFSDSVSLTMRIGFPSFSIGVSFFL